MAMDIGFVVIVGLFLIYYITVLVVERKIIQDPKIIIDKFLSIILFYAGFSLIYFSLTGEPFLNDSPKAYNIYIFVIGFISVLWTIPNLLKEFTFFERFLSKKSRKIIKSKKGIIE